MANASEVSTTLLTDFVRETILPDLPADFPADSDLFEAGLDSMGVMQLVMFLEERFGKKVEPEELSRANFRSGNALAALVNGSGMGKDHDKGQETAAPTAGAV